MPPPALFLIRHPAPAIAPGICYGRSDIGLLADPLAAARRLTAQLPGLDRVYSSPLQRCLRLARCLAPSPVTDTRLMEMDFGAWEGRSWDDIPRPDIDAWARQPLDFAPPGGESGRQVAARVIEFASEFIRRNDIGNIAVISHQGPLRILMAHLLGDGEALWLSRRFDFAAVTRLDALTDAPGRYRLAATRARQDQT